MHNDSLPPSDREPSLISHTQSHPPHDPDLIERLMSLRGSWESHTKLGRKVNYSPAVITLYLAGKYTGDVAEVEARLRDYVANEERRRMVGVDTVVSDVTKAVRAAFDLARETNDVSVVVGEPGVGKTRAIDLYVNGNKDQPGNPTCVHLVISSWNKDLSSIEGALMAAVGKAGYDNRTRRAEWLVQKLRNSDRLIIVDDAHKLTQPALQWIFDFHEATGCPVALVGTPALEAKLRSDSQRFSRVGLKKPLSTKKRRALIEHLIGSLVGNVSDSEEAELAGLCDQVAAQHGHFRSVAKQLKLAAHVKRKQPTDNPEGPTSISDAFRAAHNRLFRDYSLS